MALFDIFKKRKPHKPSPLSQKGEVSGEKPERKKKVKKETEKVKKPEVKVEKKPERKTEIELERPAKSKRTSGIAYGILKEPHVTEKATDLTKKNQYVFKVFSKTNKFEIKRAVEDLYGVDVISVKIIKILRKKRRLGRIEGWRKGYKKALVGIKRGQKIEVLPR